MASTHLMDSKQEFIDLTQSQLLLWAGQQLSPNAPLYNMALAFNIYGEIEVESFSKAFQALIQQADVLRTTFHEINGIPKQQILPTLTHQLSYIDWEAEQRENDNTLHDYLKMRTQQLMDLSSITFDTVLIKVAPKHFVWFLNQHHLTTDATSVSVLYQAMNKLYAKALKGDALSESFMPEFKEYILFEREAYTSPKKQNTRLYWREKVQLVEQFHASKLYGRTTKAARSKSFRQALPLGSERSNALRALSQHKEFRAWTQHLSLFNMLATVLFAWMHRVSGQQKLSIGAPTHNRPTNDFKKTAGIFIEFFPLITEWQEQDSFLSLFQRVRIATNEFLRNAQPGVSRVEMNRQFYVVLNYINANFSDFNGLPMASEWIHSDYCDPQHQIRLHVHDFDDSGEIQLYFDINDELFGEETATAIPQHFLLLLDAFITDQTQQISQVSLLTTKEKDAFNDALQVVDFTKTTDGIHHYFEKQVAKLPNQLALSYEQQTWTYQELNDQANQLNHFLLEQGIQAGDCVALFFERTAWFVIAVLGTLKANATFIPIAANTPKKRIQYILDDVNVACVLTQTAQLNKLPERVPKVVDLDGQWEDNIQHLPNIDLKLELLPQQVAYIIYTSGSTGKPKGVMVTHEGLCNYINWAKNTYVSGEYPRFPLFTQLSFDLTITSLFTPFVCGGSLVIYQERNTNPDLTLLDVIAEDQVDIIKLTPSHLSLLLGRDLSASAIKTIIVGGEDFKTALALAVLETFGNTVQLYNEYGPTEATVGCMVHQFDLAETQEQSVYIGEAIDQTQVYVLDKGQNPVPQGVVGELYIAGKGLALGYCNNPSLTAERFVENPFIPDAKMYKTGDLARMTQSGKLIYLGRLDQQVKIGGIRVELGEIEQALLQLPNVKQCFVDLEEGDNRQESIDYCSKCGLPSNYPNTSFDEEGLCHLCRSFDTYEEKAATYFKELTDLKQLFDDRRKIRQGEYDCLLLLSGGKDSSYALGQLVEMGLNVLAFTLDNGYISEQAKANIRRVTNDLGVDHIFETTPAMNEIFVDSLHRHHNVCNGCFKALYTLSTKVALEKQVPFIVTGLSRGQFFETRLTEELFWDKQVDVNAIDETILTARKAYHRVEDAVCKLLDVSMFADDQVFEQVQFVDFYRYTDVSLDDMLAFLDEKLPWVRPTDTGRSTNCLINQVGIYVHKKNVGYNNYAFPYSWDVRLGHKTRVAALDEINEEVDEQEVKKIMKEIGYVDQVASSQQELIAYYVGDSVTVDELKAHLTESLPAYMVPNRFVELKDMPLTSNGKVDQQALRSMKQAVYERQIDYVAPSNVFEEMLVELWEKVLQLPKIGVHDNFIAIGGNSLIAIRLIAHINEAFQLNLSVDLIFDYPTIGSFAEYIEALIRTLLNEED